MVNLKIDGKTVEIEQGATILAAAEKAGIRIPTLCFLKKVSPTGACRICVVEIEGVAKPMAACHTPAVDGMVVTTQSEKLYATRKQIIELLLVNHPLDCPVCDAGGECELQNITYEFNVTRQSFEAEDVSPGTIDGWPLIQQVPNRCVLCEKCVKVCHEVVGASALFTNDKGDKAFIDKHLDLCEYCGNCVQVCPTGTMISKTFKFRARPWELHKTATVCTLCSGQCETEVQTKGNEIFRVVAEDGCGSNDGNLCIGGFFSHGYVASDRRLTAPLLKQDGIHQQPVSWEEALSRVVEKGRAAGGAACAGLGSPRLTNEENYLFQKLFRVGLGSNNLDSEARFGFLRGMMTLRDQLGLGGASNRYDRIGSAAAVLVFGADVTAEAPLVDWQIERACRQGDGKLMLANMRRVKLARHANIFLQYKPGSETGLALALARLIVDKGLADEDFLNQYLADPAALEQLRTVDIDQAAAAAGVSRALLEEAADHIGGAESVAIIFGGDLLKGRQAEAATAALADLALVSGALHGDVGGLFPLDEKGNMQGVVDMGMAPELLPGQQDYASARQQFEKAWGVSLPSGGRDAVAILEGIEQGDIHFLYLAGVNPLVDFPESGRWRQALDKVDFLVVQDILASELTEYADLVLPGVSFAEKSGTVTSHDGRLGYLQPALKPVGEARPDGQIFAELLALLDGVPLEAAALQTEIKDLCGLYEDVCFTGRGRRSCQKLPWQPQPKQLKILPVSPAGPVEGLQLLAGTILFQFGSTTTYAPGPAEVAPAGYIEMNPQDGKACGVRDGGRAKLTTSTGSAVGPVRFSDAVPQGLVFAPVHFADVNVQQAIPSGSCYVAVEISKP